MKIVCAWCKKTIKDGPGEPVSHGMCPACYKKYKGFAGIGQSVAPKPDGPGTDVQS